MTSMVKRKPRKPFDYPPYVEPYCKCGHTALIHGLNGCEGVHTPFDGPYTKIEDCPASSSRWRHE